MLRNLDLFSQPTNIFSIVQRERLSVSTLQHFAPHYPGDVQFEIPASGRGMCKEEISQRLFSHILGYIDLNSIFLEMELKINNLEKPPAKDSTTATYEVAAPIPGIGKYLFNGMVVTLNGVPVESHTNTLHMRNYINLTFFKKEGEKKNVLKQTILYDEYATVTDMDAHKTDTNSTPYKDMATAAEKERTFRVFDRLDIELGRSNKYMIPGVRVSVENCIFLNFPFSNRLASVSAIRRMRSEFKLQQRQRNRRVWRF